MNEDGFTSFLCAACHTEIEASPDMIGMETECPACGARIVVPDNRDDGSSHAPSGEGVKSRTIRIELGDL